jgi:transcriptional regulator with XRE-family HTH domain
MPRKLDPIDALVGKNIRIFRIAKGLSQTDLGQSLGVTFQQVQKYEKGVNRVGSGRLARLSKLLGVPINRFFDNSVVGVDGPIAGEIVTDLLASPYSLRMLKALAKIPDKEVRRSLVTLTESLAGL